MSLSQKTTTGIVWNFAEQLARRGIQVTTTLLLAHFLAPEDFGLVAMMSVFLAIGTSLMDSGFKQALIRMQSAEQVDFNTAFYANITLGAIAATLLIILAPAIANFYHEPRLIYLIRAASLAIVFNAFQIVQAAALSQQLNFRAQLKASLPAATISGITAVVLAYLGWGVWALIVQMLLNALISTSLIWRQTQWRPTLTFSLISLGRMYNFGYKLFLSGLLDTIFKNFYVIVIAKLYSSPIAGLYFFAEKIKELLVSQIVSAIQTVTYSAFSSIQDDDIRLKSGYRKVIIITTFFLFPVIFLLAALAQPLFEVFLAEKWWPAVTYLQLMAIAGVLYPLQTINLNILEVKGRSDIFLYLEVLKKFVMTMTLLITYKYGVYGMLIGLIMYSMLEYLFNSYYSKKLIQYSIMEQISDALPSFLLSVAVALLAYALQQWVGWSAILKLILIGSLSATLYLVGAWLLQIHACKIAIEIITDRKKLMTNDKFYESRSNCGSNTK